MRKKHLFLNCLFLTFALLFPSALAQITSNGQWGLPEGATARLGKGIISEITYSPDGNRLAVASTIGIWLYDVPTLKELNLITGHTDGVRSVCFSPDGKTLASGSADNTVRLWAATTGQHLKTLIGHTEGVESVCFSPDGKTLASGSADNMVRLWAATTGQHLKTLTGHTEWVASVCFSPDGKTLASGSGDDTVRLWAATTGKPLKTLIGHTDYVSSVCFSPDGKTLASGSGDDTVRLWAATTGKLLKTLTGHTSWVRSVCFSPDSKTLAGGSWDNMVRLWDVTTGQHLEALTGHTWGVHSVCFSPDGKTLASGSWKGTILLWSMSIVNLQLTREQIPAPAREVPTPQTPQQIAKSALAATVLIVMEDASGQTLSTGSGFFVDQGIIATNLHVVEGVFKGYVKRVGMNRTSRIESIVAMDSRQDLAIIEVSDISAPVLPIGRSDKVQIGESIYVAGNPIGFLEGTFSNGIVSGVREFRVGSKRIQITAPISEGSSGGPVLNSKGEVIGVAVSTITAGQNLNFAIPSNYLSELLNKARGRK